MSKVIKRPESTTIVEEAYFHVCKDYDEVCNALLGAKPEDIVVYLKALGEETFTPMLFIIVKSCDLPLGNCYKYVVNSEHFTKWKEQAA